MSQPWPSTRSRRHARHAAPAPQRRVWPGAAAIAVAVVGVAGVLVATLTTVGEAESTVVSAAPATPPATIAAPVVAAPPRERATVAAEAAPSATPRPTPTRKAKRPTTTAAECTRIAMRSSLSNADLRPYLRSLGCDAAADSLLVGSAGPATTRRTASVDPGKAALQACREQTGQTTAQCVDQARRGLAN